MLLCSHTHADIYLTNSLPGGKPHTFCREEKQQEKVKRTKWWSRDKDFGGRKWKRKEWEADQEGGAVEKRIIWAKQKGRKKGKKTEPLQTVFMYVSSLSSYTCPFNPGINGAPAVFILSGSSFISLSQGLISPFRALHSSYFTKLDVGAL